MRDSRFRSHWKVWLGILVAGAALLVWSLSGPSGKDHWFPSPIELIAFGAGGFFAGLAFLGMGFEVAKKVVKWFGSRMY